MRKLFPLLVMTIALCVAAPAFAHDCIEQVIGPTVWYQCVTGGPTVSDYNTTYHPGELMCNTWNWTDFYKASGSNSAHAVLEWWYLTPSNGNGYVDISLTVELTNGHSSSGNNLSVLVYSGRTLLETVDTISGAAGDICTNTYTYTLYRPSWANQNIRLVIDENFANTDTVLKVAAVSYIQRVN